MKSECRLVILFCLENSNYDKFVASLDTNVVHYYTLANYTLPALKGSNVSIVNICSKTAISGHRGTSGYAAFNGERLALTKDWSIELASFGKDVNAVVVAECWTPQYEWWISSFGRKACIYNIKFTLKIFSHNRVIKSLMIF